MILTPEAKHWYLEALGKAIDRLDYRLVCTKYADKKAIKEARRKLMKYRNKVLVAEEKINNIE